MPAESVIGRFTSSLTARASGFPEQGARPPVRYRPSRLVVGPPRLGNMFALMRDRLWLLEQASAAPGGLCELPLLAGSVFVASSPERIHEVLVAEADSFVKGTTFRFLRPMLGDGLLLSERAFHRRQRKLMAPAFAHRRIAAYADTMAALTEKLQSGWAEGARIDLAEQMMRVTLDIVTKTLLDADVSDDANAVGAAVSLLIRDINARSSTPIAFLRSAEPRDPKVRAAQATLDGIMMRIIHERRQSRDDRGDLLSMLLEAQEEGTGEGMSDRQVRDEAMTIFLAGHETTANALSWAFYLLARHPQAYERLRSEAVSVLGGRAATAADLPRLGYALQVFKEALRLYPPAYVTSRLTTADVSIGGQTIRAGRDVLTNIYGMQRRPEYFPEPDRFMPERFEPAAEKKIPKGAYLPFGGGARVCIGNSFALMEGQLVLATLAQRVELALETAAPIVAEPLVTLRPKGGVPMRVSRRAPAARVEVPASAPAR
ncbi:MAG TPA: cytochrome P450 [Polyangiaceae bacterium]|jgi:cytochrome P450|nr:cytochrome P450 [Polyangiaceae bacterium]